MEDGKRSRKSNNTTKIMKKSSKTKNHYQDELRKVGLHLKEKPENIKQLIPDRDEGDGESVPDIANEVLQETVKETYKCKTRFNISIELDLMVVTLFVCGVVTRMYRLEEPRSIVFDELHYGKYVGLYMKRIFFFDAHPPFGKQLVAIAAYLAGFDGSFKFDRIGREYEDSVPLFALRLVPALCGSLLMPVVYQLMVELAVSNWTAALAGFLLLCDNALLTQSRFVLMESMLLLFALFGLLCVLRFRRHSSAPYCAQWWLWLALGSGSLTCALCVKYVGFFSCSLAIALLAKDYWKLLGNRKLSDSTVLCQLMARLIVVVGVPVTVYLGIFYAHLSALTFAGPHDSVMSSAFQASLEGGLASITRGQPLEVAHGSQITLRHSHGRTCWLHSHSHVYPIRYPDKRGSSHQQQVTCYSFKDVNNWWIVKRPLRNDLVVSQPVDAVRHGDVVQLVHGMTSRALNSHDVAAPVSPQNQEVSCYIDYNVSMPAQNLWRVDIINRDQVGDVWLTIESLVRLIHVNSSQALKFSGRQLPDWGFNQHEVVTDRAVHQDDTVWNVEEHRYTQTEDQKDRERELVNAEMIPLRATTLSFWEKFVELQYKMLFSDQENVQNHMYSSEPLEWPLLTRGIAYWVSPQSNAQVHLLGNIVVWYSGTVSLFLYGIFLGVYILRRRRQCFDLDTDAWQKFITIGEVLVAGYLFHYIPFFFVERTLFLHHYLPAFAFKVLLTAAMVEHVLYFVRNVLKWQLTALLLKVSTAAWLLVVLAVFRRFAVLSYGATQLTTAEVLGLRWRETWDFIVHRH